MTNHFINCFTAEWIKQRRSFASWLVLLGGFFVPGIIILVLLCYPQQLISLHASGHFWEQMFQKSWQLMAFMLLPMGIVLSVSLITQLEFKSNTWKQLNTTPVTFAVIYFSKLAVLLVMLLQLFVFFNIGIYLSAVIPSLLNSRTHFPNYKFDFAYFLKENTNYFILCLPMVALQYLISLQTKHFLIPIVIGLALVVGGLIAISWKLIFTIPSAYTALYFLQSKTTAAPLHDLRIWSLIYFVFFTLTGYLFYIFKKEKG
ncbi:MAG: ABC transporter permease [Ferruginibacter sp.]